MALLDATVPVDEAAAAGALDPLTLEDLECEALVERVDGQIRARFRIQRYNGLLVASDPDDGTTALAPDHVMPVTASTRTAAALTVRRPVADALDLCTGGGVHALLAARHAGRVVGTDLSPRALELARLSERLSGIDAVDWRLGDLFEPVGDERFDLIVANPPFVIGPGRELWLRDGGVRGDELSRHVATGAAARLRPGGFATILCNWLSQPGEEWQAAPARWLADSGCDAWLLRVATDDPVTYAASWNSLPRAGSRAVFAERVAAWVDHYRDLGIQAITSGAIVLRRRTSRNWIAAEDAYGPTPRRGDRGAQLERIFAAHDFLAGRGTGALLDERLAFAPGARLVVSSRPAASGAQPRVAQVALDDGLPLSGRFPGEALPLVERLEGVHTVRELGGTVDDAAALEPLYARGFLARCESPAGVGRTRPLTRRV